MKNIKTLQKVLVASVVLLGFVCQTLAPLPADAMRLKDLARVKEVRDNQIVGYGLVVGLQNTGDKSRSTQFMQQNLLQNFGSLIPNANDIRGNNVASVMVTAKVPPFAKPGDKIDVLVSSAADAKSLEGGVLLQTQLVAPNGEVIALAQGPVSVGGASASAGGASARTSITTSARIPNGGIIEREIKTDIGDSSTIELVFQGTDFELASRAADLISQNVAPAQAVDASTVRVDVPQNFLYNRVPFVAKVLGLQLNYQDETANIIVNERTGTVVIGNEVRLLPAAVAHGGITVTISPNNEVSQPNAFGQGQTLGVSNPEIKIEEKTGSLIQLGKSATLRDLVQALNAIGVTPTDLITILQALKEAGSLQGNLEII